MYKLPIHLYEKFIRNASLKGMIFNCWHDGVEYQEMLEQALSVQTERAENFERKLANEKMLKSEPQVFAGVFNGEDLFTSPQAKEAIDYLQGQINYLSNRET